MAIRLLPPEVASQIAAGEVIERPASVVKELIENALDASAKHIRVTVQEAGRRLVEVSDDGTGIPSDEIQLSVSRHATSKLSQAEDLFHIQTLGFRGEALASIGSVARLTIISRQESAEAGARLVVEGGHNTSLEITGAPTGTLVRVEDLFYNVPARLKFLKSDATERRQIDALVTRYALAYPRVRWELWQDGRAALQTSGNGDRREVLGALYGADIARQMLEVLADEETLQVSGFISPTSLTRSNRRDITFFVNGRPVQDAALSAALIQAYHTMLMVGRYPMAVLFLEIQADLVDVNVHPTKAEVRFKDSGAIFSGVQRSVRRALMAHTPVPELSQSMQWAQGSWQSPASGGGLTWDQGSRPEKNWSQWDDVAAGGSEGVEAQQVDPQPALPQLRTPILRLVGQVATAFLVAEGPDGLYLIDQHAAHERVLFEKLMAQHDEASSQGAGIPAQALIQPVPVDLPPAAARSLEEQLGILNHLGFRLEPFGPGTFLVRAIPALLSGMDPASALRVLVEDFEEDETPLRAEIEARIVARVCKRAAIKAGKVLSTDEQQALLHDLEACQSPRTCPHGRPTMIHLSVDLLERQFGRKGAR